MITLGIDIGSSSIKTSLWDASKGESIATASFPPQEMEIISKEPNWAEQNPEIWMENLFLAIAHLKQQNPQALKQAQAIGITYQMHGLVLVDKNMKALRNAIIWCDSRAVEIGNKAFEELGNNFCLDHFLNSPGNFTASKLKWVMENEPGVFGQVHRFMLPGDYVASRLTQEIVSTPSGLSEGIFWDFKSNALSDDILDYFGFPRNILPDVAQTFSIQGRLTPEMAATLGMAPGTPVTYRAGDQPNNALSLNVLQPGEVAATAGTSGVVYGVTDTCQYDPYSRVNTFLHANHTTQQPRLGILLCLNSVGILNSWVKQQMFGNHTSYDQMNLMASEVAEGSEGLMLLPFGNGAERVLKNQNPGASVHGLNLTRHRNQHFTRALQESIAFAFNYGLEIMQPLGLNLKVIRAGKANLFLSPLFTQTLANLSGACIELCNTNGAEGAARGAAIGTSYFATPGEAFQNLNILEVINPNPKSKINMYYQSWRSLLTKTIQK